MSTLVETTKQTTIITENSVPVLMVETGPRGPSGEAGPPGAGFNWRGAYDNATTYAQNESVSYQGSSWVTLRTTLGNAPVVGDDWDLVAQKGDTGAAGANGSDGADGTNGTNGVDGEDGKTILNGSGAPGSGLGVDGDFYLDTTNFMFYGPKAAGAWPTGVGLMKSDATGITGGSRAANLIIITAAGYAGITPDASTVYIING